MGAVRIKVLAQHKYVCTAMQISQLIYRFSAGQLHILIHINETLENLGFWFDTLLPSFQEWDMCSECRLCLGNLSHHLL